MVSIIALVPTICVTLYAGGLIAQFILNYQAWAALGGELGSQLSPALPSLAPADCLHAVTIFPEGLYGVGVFLALMSLLVIMVMRMGLGDGGGYDEERNLAYSAKGTYGTAGYMTKREFDEVLKLEEPRRCRGTILGELDGKLVTLPEDSRLNQNIAVYGASGSMKSRAYARNRALQSIRRGESLVVTDSKGELYADLYEYAKGKGYTARVFNLIHPECSDSWACLLEVGGDQTMAQIFADTVIKNTGNGKGDHFWDAGEQNLLKALILYVDQGYPPESKNFGEVYKLLTLNDVAALGKLFDVLPMDHPARAPYSIFKKASESVQSGVIVGLGARLQLMQNPLICAITSKPEIDLELPGREKCIYFLVMSDQDSTFSFVVSLFFSFLFIRLARFADQQPTGRLPVPVHIIGDEWPALAGTVVDFPQKISTIRSRAISISVIFQNIAQLQNRYPYGQWQEILGNCDTQLFLGCSDEDTADLISRRTGVVSVQVSSKSKMLGTWRVTDYSPQYRETSSVGKRQLMTMDEIMRMPMDEALVIIRGHNVLKVKKFDYVHHPDTKHLVRANACDHVPEWVKAAGAESFRSGEPARKRGKRADCEGQMVLQGDQPIQAMPKKDKEPSILTIRRDDILQ